MRVSTYKADLGRAAVAVVRIHAELDDPRGGGMTGQAEGLLTPRAADDVEDQTLGRRCLRWKGHGGLWRDLDHGRIHAEVWGRPEGEQASR